MCGKEFASFVPIIWNMIPFIKSTSSSECQPLASPKWINCWISYTAKIQTFAKKDSLEGFYCTFLGCLISRSILEEQRERSIYLERDLARNKALKSSLKLGMRPGCSWDIQFLPHSFEQPLSKYLYEERESALGTIWSLYFPSHFQLS